ncbi:hypothetical protein [Ruminococcus sp.]|uniref:hypothetical protein n=1 Tax=Ruminococcus sp. TaxID=41978 RepID=UPI00396763F5
MTFLYFLIFVGTLVAVYLILLYFGVFESSKGVSKANAIADEENKQRKIRNREKNKLATFAALADAFHGIVLPKMAYEKHKDIINRLEIRSEILGRNLTPEELKGKFMLCLFGALICLIFGFFFKLMWAVGAVLLIVYFAYIPYYKQKIQDEDDIIDTYFIDLYLLMYSKLRLGSKARLQTVVESYIDTLQIASDPIMKETMMKFAKFFLNNLTMYEDHEAIPHLRERYHSATIVNFCNVATQALQGIDNGDALLTFKVELTRRKTDIMKKNAEKLRLWGERSIYLIYIILFILIGVGWYSKLPTDFF